MMDEEDCSLNSEDVEIYNNIETSPTAEMLK
jgi:hypothetical protein